MKSLLSIAASFWLACVAVHAQVDSTAKAKLSSMLAQYYDALMLEPLEVKYSECDYLIESCKDSLVRQFVATSILQHYMDPPLMGEESVAIYLYDKWFIKGDVQIADDWQAFEAELFYRYNKDSMIDSPAPVLDIKDRDGNEVRLPEYGSPCVIYFYDTSCAKCKLLTAELPSVLENVHFPLTLYAVYSGSERGQWVSFMSSFKTGNPRVRIVHLWDEDDTSNFQMKYAVSSTPKVFFVDSDGIIRGRRLDAQSLQQIISIYNLYYVQGEKE